VRKQDGQGTTIYAGLYQLRTDTSGNRQHVLTLPTGVAMVVRNETGGTEETMFVHRDHIGSVTSVTDEAGNVREEKRTDPFGANIVSASEPYLDLAIAPPAASGVRGGFAGHETDSALGLVNMRGRMYDPTLARFITPDPLNTNPLLSQSHNRYSYVMNSPLALIDPTGFSWKAAGRPEENCTKLFTGNGRTSCYEEHAAVMDGLNRRAMSEGGLQGHKDAAQKQPAQTATRAQVIDAAKAAMSDPKTAQAIMDKSTPQATPDAAATTETGASASKPAANAVDKGGHADILAAGEIAGQDGWVYGVYGDGDLEMTSSTGEVRTAKLELSASSDFSFADLNLNWPEFGTMALEVGAGLSEGVLAFKISGSTTAFMRSGEMGQFLAGARVAKLAGVMKVVGKVGTVGLVAGLAVTTAQAAQLVQQGRPGAAAGKMALNLGGIALGVAASGAAAAATAAALGATLGVAAGPVGMAAGAVVGAAIGLGIYALDNWLF
jgi:RHS repeat-associated protein